jgi:hypothetical protein
MNEDISVVDSDSPPENSGSGFRLSPDPDKPKKFAVEEILNKRLYT